MWELREFLSSDEKLVLEGVKKENSKFQKSLTNYSCLDFISQSELTRNNYFPELLFKKAKVHSNELVFGILYSSETTSVDIETACQNVLL